MSTEDVDDFLLERVAQIRSMGQNPELRSTAYDFFLQANASKYSYNFDWLSRPIIQYPQDVVAVQELVWRVRPDLIIETGIARGGSLVLSASLLALLDLSEAIESREEFDYNSPKRFVVGVDVDLRAHNRDAITAHPLSKWIRTIEGSSTEDRVFGKVSRLAEEARCVMVFLDSNHTRDHVLRELFLYAPLVSVGSYCVVFDTVIEDLPLGASSDRPWGPGNNPKTAVHEFLRVNSSFEIDHQIHDKLQITVARDGYLRKISP